MYRAEGEPLVAHRAAAMMSSVRTFGASTPLLAASLISWRQELVLLVVVCGVTALASGYSTWRALRELKHPASEHFTLEGQLLTRFVGGRKHASLDQRHVRTMMQNRSAFAAYGRGTQIIVPRITEGFDELMGRLSAWGSVATPASIGKSALGEAGFKGAFFAVLAVGAVAYFVLVTGTWKSMVMLLPAGLVPAELLGRWAVKAARTRALTTF